ncbi:MAG: hypothetical protein GVY33_00405 [Alphaproteobacteria bacterium]|nr:hypothetical protein [Alphaproteobacteria bacterium]
MFCEDDEGSSQAITVTGAVRRRAGSWFGVNARIDGATGRPHSVTGVTLTRRHQRAGRYTTPSDEPSGASGDPFDHWVDRQLRSLYGPVVDEPLPPRLRALLDAAAHGDEPAPPADEAPERGDGDARAGGADREDDARAGGADREDAGDDER